MVETIAKRSGPVARRAFEIVSAVFAHGVARHLVIGNPCAAEAIRDPWSTRCKAGAPDVELGTLMPALPLPGEVNAVAAKILLATCVRKSDLLKARWTNVDLEQARWTGTDEKTKTGKRFAIPIC